ncbi:MAG: patatin-like phospholipase family protein [Pseudoxanthomonas sp.]
MDNDANRGVAPRTAQQALADEIANQVGPRRSKAGITGDTRGTWGLALSGGGIRSATFCLGLIRGLAKNEVLKEFDYLSTVSGGGYVGASLGRLYSADKTAREVEDGVKSDGSMWLWWLRNNGRYLTPTGAKDLGFATASILRGIIATHLEIGILLLLLAGMVLLPHVLVSLDPPTQALTPWSQDLVNVTNSIWWWLLPLPAFVFLHQVISYWYTREQRTTMSMAIITAAALIGLAASRHLSQVGLDAYRAASDAPESFSALSTLGPLLLALLLLTPATAWLATALDWVRGTPIAEIRLKRTKRLSYALWGFGLVIGLALIDIVSWFLTRLFWQWGPAQLPLGKTALLGLLLAAGRYALPEIQKRIATSKKPSLNVEKLLNALGILLAIAALVFWTTLFNIVLFPQSSWYNPTPVGTPLWDIPQIRYWIVIVGLCFVYALGTCRSFELLNLASLHNFYRARIERAYVSSGNSEGEQARFPSSALTEATSAQTMRVAPLTEAIEGDDVPLTEYAPHEHGGPIHLVNCCINQSVDDRTGIYNADRKGVALTVSSLGVEIGCGFAASNAYANPPGNLSRWIAISGAAASTGMGSRTSPGFATLLFMSGIRLGYWTKALVAKASPLRSGSSGIGNALGKYAPKPLAIIAESLARFPGQFGSIWYVSDGGHFDNTGVYALLKRKCRLVVCADCGADPKYLFSDLESLVRKAKIDYGATIEFVDPDRVSERVSQELKSLLGTPETVTPEADSRWLVLGRIRYSDQSEGTLVVVKPRRLDKMPFDIVAYADRNPDFPQQTTGDQFFDESQWEAYHQLGVLMGRRLTRTNLRSALTAVEEMTNAPSSLAMVEASNNATLLEPRQSRRSRVGLTVGASLGAGLSLSVLLALWQGIDQYRESRRAADRDYEQTYEGLRAKILDKDNVLSMSRSDFSAFAEESKDRSDGRFKHLGSLLNNHCATLAEGSDPALRCKELYDAMSREPPPIYNYWFADRPARAQGTQAPAIRQFGLLGGAAAPTSAQVVQTPEATVTVQEPAMTAAPPPAPEESPAPPPAPEDSAVPAPPPPVAVVAAMPAAAAATVDWTAAQRACNPGDKKRARIYIHIYDEITRKEALALADKATSLLGLPRPTVENVVHTAERSGRLAPYKWSTPALVYHDGVESQCLAAIQRLVGPPQNVVLRPLPASLKDNPGMVEVWLPPEEER